MATTGDYSRDSFDRFGDDLNQLLLSYTTFVDSFRHESVSGQWKRSLNQSVTEKLYIGYEWPHVSPCLPIDSRTLALILAKCPNITAVDINRTIGADKEAVFLALIDNCPQLTAIEADFDGLSADTMKSFLRTFSPTLKSIKFKTSRAENESVVIGCSRVPVLDIKEFYDMSPAFLLADCLPNNLADIAFAYAEEDTDRIGRLCRANQRSLRRVEANAKHHYPTNEFLVPLFRELATLSRLQTLALTTCSQIDQRFGDSIRAIGHQCPRLSRVKFILHTNSPATNQQIYDAMDTFPALKCLEIYLFHSSATDDAAGRQPMRQTLRHCRALRSLSVRAKYLRQTERFFADIGKYMPRLRRLKCMDAELSDQVFARLATLRDLRSIDFHSVDCAQDVTELAVVELIRRCRRLRSLICRSDRQWIELSERHIQLIRESGGPVAGLNIIEYNSPHMDRLWDSDSSVADSIGDSTDSFEDWMFTTDEDDDEFLDEW